MTLYSISSVTKRQTNIQTLRSYIRTSIIRTKISHQKSNIKWNLYKNSSTSQIKSFPCVSFDALAEITEQLSCTKPHTSKLENFFITLLSSFTTYLFCFFADIVNLYFIEVKRANSTWSSSFYLGKAKINHLYYPNKFLSSKGSLISECFSFWLKSPKKGARSRHWVSFL